MTESTGWANAAGSSLPTTKPSFENSTLSKAFRSCYRSWLPAWSDYLKAVSLFITPKTFADTLRRRSGTRLRKSPLVTVGGAPDHPSRACARPWRGGMRQARTLSRPWTFPRRSKLASHAIRRCAGRFSRLLLRERRLARLPRSRPCKAWDARLYAATRDRGAARPGHEPAKTRSLR